MVKEIMLQEARKNHHLKEQAQAEDTEKQAAIVETATPADDNKRLFADFMLQWLEMMKNSIELITYISYSNAVKGRVDPYFRKKGVMLKDLTTVDIQTFYTHEMNVRGVSVNTVIHYHANIRKAFSMQ